MAPMSAPTTAPTKALLILVGARVDFESDDGVKFVLGGAQGFLLSRTGIYYLTWKWIEQLALSSPSLHLANPEMLENSVRIR